MDARTPEIAEADLHAFVDGQLAPDRLAAVLAWLDSHPADAQRVLHWQAQRTGLRQLAQSLALDETPAALTQVVRRAQWRGRQRWAQAAAVLAALALGVVLGRLWPAPTGGAVLADASPGFVREAVAAHAVYVPEKRHPVEVAAADQAHLVQWLSRRLGAPLKAPQLQGLGYQLLGGRLLPGEGTPRAQFMYENAQGARLTLYQAVFTDGTAPAPTAFRSISEGPRQSFYWTDARFGYALSGELANAELQAVAREVYAQLSP